jgi:hypothetical protein
MSIGAHWSATSMGVSNFFRRTYQTSVHRAPANAMTASTIHTCIGITHAFRGAAGRHWTMPEWLMVQPAGLEMCAAALPAQTDEEMR